MSVPRRITLAELLIGVGVLAIALFLLCYGMHYQRSEARRTRCRNNLSQLAKGMETYMSEPLYPWPVGRPGCGTKASPDFGGAEWLATLYWTHIVPDPDAFNCPTSSDNNGSGRKIGSHGCPGSKRLSPDAVSYAGMGDVSIGVWLANHDGRRDGRTTLGRRELLTEKMAIRADFPGTEPMACDDTEEPINHGRAGNGGMNVLFFDSHVEWWTHERVDLERGVGTGELVHLRN
ncbi:MAG: hypothetical protein FJ291_05130 [Planctomycetes bacterium]|nr:hypothetical protein [Planctomycetota bacterium]